MNTIADIIQLPLSESAKLRLTSKQLAARQVTAETIQQYEKNQKAGLNASCLATSSISPQASKWASHTTQPGQATASVSNSGHTASAPKTTSWITTARWTCAISASA